MQEYWVNVYQRVGIGTWYSKNKYSHRPDYYDYFMRPAYRIHVKMKSVKPKYEQLMALRKAEDKFGVLDYH